MFMWFIISLKISPFLLEVNVENGYYKFGNSPVEKKGKKSLKITALWLLRPFHSRRR